jgi:hypothetical protein
MIPNKSKIRKSWYASSGMKKDEYYEHMVKVHSEREEKRDFLYSRDEIIKKNIAPKTQELKDQLAEYHHDVCDKLETILERRYRMAYSASHHESGHFRVSSQPSVYVSRYNDWNIYSKSTRYPAKVNYNVISLPRFYELPPKYLQIIDGLVNVRIKHYKNVENINVYEAAWVKQEFGNNVSLVYGYIAHFNNVYYHALDMQEAVKGVQRKYKKLQSPNVSQKAYSEWKPTDYISRIVFHKVTGACMEGIRDFCNKAEIPNTKKRMQIKEVLPLIQEHAPSWYRIIVKNAPQLVA